MRLIVVGAGWAGQRHVEAARAVQRRGGECEVAALVDTDARHLAAKAEQWQIPGSYTDLEQAIQSCPDVQAVVIATPHHLHRVQTEIAAGSGLHVLVEKPITVTLTDADAMIAACNQAGVTLMVAEIARYHLANIAARDAIVAGRIGQVLSGRICLIGKGRHSYAYPGRRSWLADPETPGAGIWMLNGIHRMSVARMLLGEVRAIYAREVHSEQYQSPLEATVVAMLSFDSGAEVTMTVSAELHGYKRFGDTLIFGSEGTLHLPQSSDDLTIYGSGEPETIALGQADDERALGSFVRQMEEFISAADHHREPATGGVSERKSLAAILAGYESIRTHRHIVLG